MEDEASALLIGCLSRIKCFDLNRGKALEAFKTHKNTKGLERLLAVGLSEIIAENRRAAEMSGGNVVNGLTLDFLLDAFRGQIKENPIKLVVLVFFDKKKSYEVNAYPTNLFHKIAWIPKPETVGPNPDNRMSFDPNTLADKFKFDSIDHFKKDFRRRFPGR